MPPEHAVDNELSNKILKMNTFKSLIVKLALILMARLSIDTARSVARLLANPIWSLGGRSYRVTRRNIELAYPQLDGPAQSELAKKSFLSTAELAGEMGWVWLRPWIKVQTKIRHVSGAELVTDALKEGRGVVVIAPHLGNWEILGLHLGILGQVVSLYEPVKLEGLGYLIGRSRQRSGALLVPTNKRGLASLVKSVRAGNIAGILPDQVPSEASSGENVEFMGNLCFTGTLTTKIIRRTGALAVYGFAERIPGGFQIRYLPAPEKIYSENIFESLTALNSGVEKCISFCPEQYQWEYKRFRTYPRELSQVYKN